MPIPYTHNCVWQSTPLEVFVSILKVLEKYSCRKPQSILLRAFFDQVPLNYPSETVVQPSSTAHFHYGFPTVEL